MDPKRRTPGRVALMAGDRRPMRPVFPSVAPPDANPE